MPVCIFQLHIMVRYIAGRCVLGVFDIWCVEEGDGHDLPENVVPLVIVGLITTIPCRRRGTKEA